VIEAKHSMAPEKIKHFLVVYAIPAGQANVREFGTDYDSALRAYDAAEEAHRHDPDYEVVLLGSDSLETLKKTHSSYFDLGDRHVNDAVGRELAELGLRY
jgi:hypothetical protein